MEVNKYNKKLRYREHPSLKDRLTLEQFFILLGFTGVINLFLIFLTDNDGYSSLIKTIDFWSLIILVVYSYILRPKIYRGKIKAYYRRDYKMVSKVTNGYFILIGTLSSNFLTRTMIRAMDLKSFNQAFQGLFHPMGILVTVSTFVMVIYIIFYNDKYVSVQEFSDEVNYRMMFKKMHLQGAIDSLYRCKDKEYGVKEFYGTFYDIEEGKAKLEIEREILKRQRENNLRRERRDKDDRDKMGKRNHIRL